MFRLYQPSFRLNTSNLDLDIRRDLVHNILGIVMYVSYYE
jgi:hypothetical protein